MAEKADSLARFLDELPKLLMQYELMQQQSEAQEQQSLVQQSQFAATKSLQESQFAATQALTREMQTQREEHDIAMVTEREKIRLNDKKETQKLKDLDILYQTGITKYDTEIAAADRQILELTKKIAETTEQTNALTLETIKLPHKYQTLTDEEKTKLDPIYLGLNVQRQTNLNAKIMELNNLVAEQKNLQVESDKIGGVLSDIKAMGLRKTMVPPDRAGDPVIHEPEDFEIYFDEILVKQYQEDEATGNMVPTPDSKLPGNSNRFEPGTELTAYYKQIFVDTFGPTSEEIKKQSSAKYAEFRQQIADYETYVSKATKTLDQMKASAIASMYTKPTSKGSAASESLVIDPESKAYKAGIAVIKKNALEQEGKNISDEAAQTILELAISGDQSPLSAPDAIGFLSQLNTSTLYEDLFAAMGLSQSIKAIRGDISFGKSFLTPRNPYAQKRGLINTKTGMSNEDDEEYNKIFGPS
jgi:hypothetical protein